MCVCVVSARSCTCVGAGSAAAAEAPEDAWHWDREHQTSRDTGGLQQRVCWGQEPRLERHKFRWTYSLWEFYLVWLWEERGLSVISICEDFLCSYYVISISIPTINTGHSCDQNRTNMYDKVAWNERKRLNVCSFSKVWSWECTCTLSSGKCLGRKQGLDLVPHY